MKKIILLLILVFIGKEAFTQNYIIPFREGNKWGFANEKGIIILQPQYDFAYPASSSYYLRDFKSKIRILTKKHGKYGFLDGNFNEVIPAIYDSATPYEGAMQARVCLKDSCWFIDSAGKAQQPISFCGGTYGFGSSGEIIKKNGKYGFQEFGDTKMLLPNKYDSIINMYNSKLLLTKINHKWSIYSVKAKEFLAGTFDSVAVPEQMPYRTNFIFVSNGNKTGIINSDGDLIVEMKYDKIEIFAPLFAAYNNDKFLGYIFNKQEFWKE